MHSNPRRGAGSVWSKGVTWGESQGSQRGKEDHIWSPDLTFSTPYLLHLYPAFYGNSVEETAACPTKQIRYFIPKVIYWFAQSPKTLSIFKSEKTSTNWPYLSPVLSMEHLCHTWDVMLSDWDVDVAAITDFRPESRPGVYHGGHLL